MKTTRESPGYNYDRDSCCFILYTYPILLFSALVQVAVW